MKPKSCPARLPLAIIAMALAASSIGCVLTGAPRRITVKPGDVVLIGQATPTIGYVLNDRGQLEGPYRLVIPEGYTAAPYDWSDTQPRSTTE